MYLTFRCKAALDQIEKQLDTDCYRCDFAWKTSSFLILNALIRQKRTHEQRLCIPVNFYIQNFSTRFHRVHFRLRPDASQPHWQDEPAGHATTNHPPKTFWLTGGIDRVLAGTPSSWETRESADWRYGGRLQRRRRVRVQYVRASGRWMDMGSLRSEGNVSGCLTIYCKRMSKNKADQCLGEVLAHISVTPTLWLHFIQKDWRSDTAPDQQYLLMVIANPEASGSPNRIIHPAAPQKLSRYDQILICLNI